MGRSATSHCSMRDEAICGRRFPHTMNEVVVFAKDVHNWMELKMSSIYFKTIERIVLIYCMVLIILLLLAGLDLKNVIWHCFIIDFFRFASQMLLATFMLNLQSIGIFYYMWLMKIGKNRGLLNVKYVTKIIIFLIFNWS